MENKKFLSKRYVGDLPGKYKTYINNNGVIKECLPLLVSRVNKDKLFYDLDELPDDIIIKYHDMAISPEEVLEHSMATTSNNYVYDEDGVKIHVNPNTFVLPIVGKFLPSDGINAYTVVFHNGKPILKAILVCYNCHWSDLFSGNTKYKYNVFCLVSGLPKEVIDANVDSIIELKDVSKYLDQKNKEYKI